MRIFIFSFCIAKVFGASHCPDQFFYYEGQGCLHFGNEPGGVEWFESFFYCEQIGGFQVN